MRKYEPSAFLKCGQLTEKIAMGLWFADNHPRNYSKHYRRALRARSKITRQFPLILNQAGDLTNCSIPNSQFSSEGAVGLETIRFFRMRIENWELSNWSDSPDLAFCQVIFARALNTACERPPFLMAARIASCFALSRSRFARACAGSARRLRRFGGFATFS